MANTPEFPGAPAAVAGDKSPIDYWKSVVMENYANFNGRARRKEYWWFTVVNWGILVGLVIFAAILGAVIGNAGAVIGILHYVVFSLAMFVPSLAAGIRRLHDTDKDWYYIFVALVPFIGGLILLFFMLSEGTAGPNRFGPNPKG